MESGRVEIVNKEILNQKSKKEKIMLENGTIVFCKGMKGCSSFVGIVYGYSNKILDLENGSDAYINSNDCLYLGDTISYWRIEKILETRLIIDKVLEESEN